MNKYVLILTMLLCGTVRGMAQEFFVTPSTEVATQLAVGGANRLDTYLSPEKYRGTEVRYVSEVVRDSRKYPMTYTLTHDGGIDILHNRADNANEISGAYSFSYAAMKRWQMLDNRLLFRAGAMTDVSLGFTYNTRSSSNNPAQGYASLALGAAAMAQYTFTLWRKPLRLTYAMRMPFLGVMFSPNYGQSYYEMFSEGNYDHNIVFTSLATFQLRQQVTLDMPVSSRTSLRLGYLSDIRQAKPNNLRQHHYFNALLLGVVIRK